MVVNAIARLVPNLINVLHVAIETAKLCQELAFVQVPLPIVVVCLDPRPSIKPLVCVGLDLVDRLAKLLIVAEPLVHLVLNLTLLPSIADRNELKSLLALHTLIVPLREEEDLDV